MAGESKKTAEYLEKLISGLQDVLLSKENDLTQVILKKDAPKFHYSVSDRMYLEIKSAAELYIMGNKEPKDGKIYVFSPWHWNSGRVFLIFEEYLQELEPN